MVALLSRATGPETVWLSPGVPVPLSRVGFRLTPAPVGQGSLFPTGPSVVPSNLGPGPRPLVPVPRKPAHHDAGPNINNNEQRSRRLRSHPPALVPKPPREDPMGPARPSGDRALAPGSLAPLSPGTQLPQEDEGKRISLQS